MRKIFSSLIALAAVHCFGQVRQVDNGRADTLVFVGYKQVYDTLPSLRFEKINKADFVKFKEQFKNKLEIDPSKIVFGDSTFTLRTSKSRLVYNREINDYYRRDFSWAKYLGFISALKLYVLESWHNGGEFILGDLIVIDSISNIAYVLNTNTDGPGMLLVSPDYKYLAVYASDPINEAYSILSIIKVSKNKEKLKLEEFASRELNKSLISDIVWIDGYSLALKINRPAYDMQTGDWVDHFSYVKTTLPTK